MSELIIRASRPDDWDDIVDLAVGTFATGASADNVRRFWRTLCNQPAFRWEHLRIGEVDGVIAAHVHVVPRVLRVGKAELPIGGIAGVMTGPAYRGRHFATALMKDAFAYIGRIGCSVTLLDGINDFYHRLGYATLWPTHDCRVRVQDMRRIPAPDGYCVGPGTEDDLPALLDLYQEEWGSQPVGAIRSVDWLRWRLSFRPSGASSQTYVVRGPDGAVCGYSIGWNFTGRTEIVAARVEAMAAILRHHADQWEDAAEDAEFGWPDLPNTRTTRFAIELCSVRVTAYHGHAGGWMGRFLDPQAALELLRPELVARLEARGAAGAAVALRLDVEEGCAIMWLDGCSLRIPLDAFLPLLFGNHLPRERDRLVEASGDVETCDLLRSVFPPMISGLAGLDWF